MGKKPQSHPQTHPDYPVLNTPAMCSAYPITKCFSSKPNYDCFLFSSVQNIPVESLDFLERCLCPSPALDRCREGDCPPLPCWAMPGHIDACTMQPHRAMPRHTAVPLYTAKCIYKRKPDGRHVHAHSECSVHYQQVLIPGPSGQSASTG